MGVLLRAASMEEKARHSGNWTGEQGKSVEKKASKSTSSLVLGDLGGAQSMH